MSKEKNLTNEPYSQNEKGCYCGSRKKMKEKQEMPSQEKDQMEDKESIHYEFGREAMLNPFNLTNNFVDNTNH